ncbi:TetR/AcrR family transcriptional regulator [Actinomadura sp. DC4]|uniref:TetR/AcrR family transcriptional regulator n=1 Tax=Actinomadura sp. DC4 TaxID=3055069 RepID=UPI0025B0D63C|nr:TetR/AcrR family transcriptional regulator [Actinomadura sp. DC4]MDN3358598.1 TetR/AcrR family transcriptional regulator [Actinomadura sp. DC4]
MDAPHIVIGGSEPSPRRTSRTEGERTGIVDRRPAGQGDQRREALLGALDELLRETDLESITIADISARAGVTRSAFYFYFQNKAACVAALGVDIYLAGIAAAGHLADESLPPSGRIERMVADLIATMREHHYLYRASLEARRHSGAIREMWEQSVESFVAPVAQHIDTERAAGRAPAGPPGRTLATVLLQLSDRVLEDLSPDDTAGDRHRAEALATIWLRSIYGTAEAAHPYGASEEDRPDASPPGRSG